MSVSHKPCLNNNNVGWPFIWITCLDSEAYTEPSSTCDAYVPGCPGAFILSSLLSRHTSLTINTVILLPTCLYCVRACVLHLLCFFQCACVKMYAFFSLSLSPNPCGLNMYAHISISICLHIKNLMHITGYHSYLIERYCTGHYCYTHKHTLTL